MTFFGQDPLFQGGYNNNTQQPTLWSDAFMVERGGVIFDNNNKDKKDDNHKDNKDDNDADKVDCLWGVLRWAATMPRTRREEVVKAEVEERGGEGGGGKENEQSLGVIIFDATTNH